MLSPGSEPDTAGERRDPAAPGAELGHGGPGSPEGRELAAQLDSKYATEVVDPAWSGSAVHQLDGAVRRVLPDGTTFGSVSCRSTLCRVESFHTSLESFRSYVDASYLARDRGIWNGAFIALVTEQSAVGVKAVSFVAREGQPIPTTESIDDRRTE
jgi:hypothetical protein